MKTHRLFPVLLWGILLVFMCACGTSRAEPQPAAVTAPATATPDPADPDHSTPPPLDVTETHGSTTDTRPMAEDSSTDTGHLGRFESSLGFTLTVPDAWLRVDQNGDSPQRVEFLFAAEEGEDFVRFYDIANAEAGFGGTLVTIRLFAPGEDYSFLPDYALLAEMEQGSFVAVFPTDVQAAPENDELLAQHLAMTSDLRSFLEEGFQLK